MFKKFLPKELDEIDRTILNKYWLINILVNIPSNLINVYYVLILLEFVSLSNLGVAIVIGYSITVIFDLPTGALADTVGYRSLVILSYGMKTIAAFLILINQNFLFIVLSYVIIGIADSQESGAVQSWYDNNFMEKNRNDEEKQTLVSGSFNILLNINRIVRITLLFVSGLLASLFGRLFLFGLYTVSLALITILIYFIMTNVYHESENKKEEEELIKNTNVIRDSINKIGQALQYFRENKLVFMFFNSWYLMVIIVSAYEIAILNPLFYQIYTTNDIQISIIVSVLTITSITWTFILTPKMVKWDISKPYLYITIGVFGTYVLGSLIKLLFYIFVPAVEIFNVFVLIALILLLQISQLFYPLIGINLGKIMMQTTPSENRNTIYSAYSTIYSILSILVVYFGTNLIYYSENNILGLMIFSFTSIFGTWIVFGVVSNKLQKIKEVKDKEKLIKNNSAETINEEEKINQ